MKRILALLTTFTTALVLSSSALANALTCGHGGTCDKGIFTSQPIGTHHAGGVAGGTLPFSGLNLATVAVIAALLIAGGLTLRWATGRRS